MSSLEYGNDEGFGTELSETYHYRQYVHLPQIGITKVSGQGGWTTDGKIDANNWKGQIENAFDNIERVLRIAGLSGLDDVYLVRSYLTDIENHFGYLTEIMKTRMVHRPVYTSLSVPRLGVPEMIIEIEVEAYRK